MNDRDLIATLVCCSFVSQGLDSWSGEFPENLAWECYRIADALLWQRAHPMDSDWGDKREEEELE
jgi:hypothetical protein